MVLNKKQQAKAGGNKTMKEATIRKTINKKQVILNCYEDENGNIGIAYNNQDDEQLGSPWQYVDQKEIFNLFYFYEDIKNDFKTKESRNDKTIDDLKDQLEHDDIDLLNAIEECQIWFMYGGYESLDELVDELNRVRDDDLIGIWPSFEDYAHECIDDLFRDIKDLAGDHVYNTLRQFFNEDEYIYDLCLKTTYCDETDCYVFKSSVLY